MKSEQMINQICVERHMTKLSISSIPTWMDKNRQEGIEVRAGKIIPFWNKGGERIYDEAPGDEILKTMELLKGDGPAEESKNKEDKKDEQAKDKTDAKTVPIDEAARAPQDGDGVLPEFLTPALMSKWAKMSTIDRMLIFQRTPKEQIFQKKVGKDENGVMQMASYVKGSYMIKEANAAFLFDWKFIHQGISIGEAVCVYGTLEVNVDGKMYSRPAVGYEEINKKMTAQLAIKSATTDAIKKGLSLFGFNLDVYSGEV